MPDACGCADGVAFSSERYPAGATRGRKTASARWYGILGVADTASEAVPSVSRRAGDAVSPIEPLLLRIGLLKIGLDPAAAGGFAPTRTAASGKSAANAARVSPSAPCRVSIVCLRRSSRMAE